MCAHSHVQPASPRPSPTSTHAPVARRTGRPSAPKVAPRPQRAEDVARPRAQQPGRRRGQAAGSRNAGRPGAATRHDPVALRCCSSGRWPAWRRTPGGAQLQRTSRSTNRPLAPSECFATPGGRRHSDSTLSRRRRSRCRCRARHHGVAIQGTVRIEPIASTSGTKSTRAR